MHDNEEGREAGKKKESEIESEGKREEGRGKREEGRGKREEGRGKREEGRGKREEGRGKPPPKRLIPISTWDKAS